MLKTLRHALMARITMGGPVLGLLFAVGERSERRGNPRAAARWYARGLRRLDRRGSAAYFRVRRHWEFFLERARYHAGDGRVQDPLFACCAEPAPGTGRQAGGTSGTGADDNTRPETLAPAAGRFEPWWKSRGLELRGYVQNEATKSVTVLLNGRELRTAAVRRGGLARGTFVFQLRRELVEELPPDCLLEVRTASGEPLLWQGRPGARLRVPHGRGTLLAGLEAGEQIDKKGGRAPAADSLRERQDTYLEIYTRAREFFASHGPSPLFILYGTLLGYYRDRDFIPGDDDFDAGHFSSRSTAAEVKAEVMELVVACVLAGFTCSFNRSGRLFRLRRAGDGPHIHLDIRPLWYERGMVWAHKQACLPLKPEDVVPTEKGVLRGVEVDLPRNTEAFLEAYYGPGWKIPDPGYSNAAVRVPRRVRRKLASVCISPHDYHAMQAEIAARRPAHPGAGELISEGSHSLYPLEEYSRKCGW